jgi:predicted ATPase/DNA-binding SARP family transcriptional activator/DNA-binding CsgD family transcriptional regulator
MHTEAASDPTRKRRSSSESSFPVRIRLLGGFSVWVGSHAVGEGAWHLRKARSLVKLLALAPGHRLHRERLIDLLWPDLDPRAAINNLHHVLHHARRTLEPANAPGASRHLLLREEQLTLCPDGPLWVDVEAFQKASTVARRAREPAAYRAAIDLYSGELLPEDRYEEWAESRRQEIRRTFLSLLVELAGLYEKRGGEEELELAVQALRRALAEEPTNEEAHVGLMRLYASSGRQGEALRQYGELSEALSTELGAEPSSATRALRKEIAAGRFPLAPAQAADPPTEQSARGVGPHNLPATRTSFVDRERERIELKRELAMTRLLTLTGAGGTGKTRLAQEVARELVGAYPDGVWLVQLAGLSEPELVVQVVAATLGVRDRPGRTLGATLTEDLRTKDVLLVLDNCEHLIEAVASLTDELLGACPKLRVLATSREPLRVPGEVVRRVPSLPVPEPKDPALLSKEGLTRCAVTRLFLDRARTRKEYSAFSEGSVSAESVQAVARVCRRLEGIPLAIELAAARTTTLSVEQIDERLEDSLKLLTTGFRTADPRHRTLRATLDWSYALLSQAERVLLGRLSVFAGGWTLEAAEAVGSGDGVGEGEVLDLLSQVVDKSLVALEEGDQGVMRYTMLEPLRQYAREKLRVSGEEEAVQRRHAGYFLALADGAEPELSGPDQEEWLRRLGREHANLRAALSWALEPAGREPREHRTELGLRLAGALGYFWAVYGPGEGLGWLETGLARGEAAPKPALGKAFYEAGWIALWQGDSDRAIALLEEALALFRELGDRRGVATSITKLGAALLHRGDMEGAAVLREEAEALRGEPLDRWVLAWLTTFLAQAALYEGDYERSGALGTEALAIYRELGDKRGIVICHVGLGLTELAKGDHEQAALLFEKSLRLLRGPGEKTSVAYALLGLAGADAARGEPARAGRLWGAAETLREESGVTLSHWDLYGYDYEGRVSAARNMLGDEGAWETAWAEGCAMTPDQAVEYALGTREGEPAPPTALTPRKPSFVEAPDDPLTNREREVAVLVGRGLTDRQISSELSVSERTVHNHVRNILSKLGLRSRAQVAVWAARLGLVAANPIALIEGLLGF